MSQPSSSFNLMQSLRQIVRRFIKGKQISKVERYRRKGAVIGEKTRIFGQLDGVNPHLITIGKYCVVGRQAAVLAHGPIRAVEPVVIGDYVWIGFNALILPGVTIGDCCVIGAGAVVTKPMPPKSIIVGNPARVLRTMTDPQAEQLIDQLRSDRAMGKVDRATIHKAGAL